MAVQRPVISGSVTFCSQLRIPSPAAAWYTVIVTRSIDLAASNTIPATLLPTSEVMSEHCRFVAFQFWPATPYWSYSVDSCLPLAGGETIASMPASAGSGSGSDGWQMLLRSPMRPDWPSEQNPSRPPMSPMPGTEHGPLTLGAAGVIAATVLTSVRSGPAL